MDQNDFPKHELVSALADGQLAGDAFAGALAMLAESDEALADWHAYHVVGDALRSGDLGDARGDLAFVARLRGRLAAQTKGRPGELLFDEVAYSAVQVLPSQAATSADATARESANDSVVRWKLLAGLSSVVAVAAVGWHLASGDMGAGAQLASLPGNTLATVAPAPQGVTPGMGEPPVMLRDARLDELLAAHKQFGGTSALQMPAGFLRNATFENPGR